MNGVSTQEGQGVNIRRYTVPSYLLELMEP